VRGIPRSAWLWAALSGVLQALIFPSPSVSWLSWVALAPLLVALVRTNGQGSAPSPKAGFALGYQSGVVWYAGSCYWVYHVMHAYGGLSAPVAAALLVLFCLYLGLWHGLFGITLVLVARSPAFSGGRALALAPFLWVAMELARVRISGSPWDLLGTAQVANIPLTQIATVAGVYGVSFAIVVVNSAFAAALLLPRGRRWTMLAASLLAAGALQLGVLTQPPADPTTHTARLVQQNIPILDSSGWTVEYFEHTLVDLERLSAAPPASGAVEPSLIVWPESPAPFYVNDPRFQQTVSALAAERHAYVVAGSLTPVPRGNSTALLNSAALIEPSGQWRARYDKIHLVPFGEYVPFSSLLFFAEKLTREVGNFVPGSERTVFDLGEGKVGVFICFESIFPDEVRQFAARGAGVFVNISNDGWFGETGAPGQHLNMARMRAIENHRWVLRATNSGITAVIDPHGRVVMQAPRNVRIALDVPYTYIGETTFYTRHGDWFAFGCAIIALVALAAAHVNSKR
jgi:apolipoprotein N-acyltransferase